MHLTIHLIPKASKNAIEGWTLDARGEKVLRVKVTAVPEDGKANEVLIKLLSKTLHISQSKISLVRGHTSRIKELQIDGDEGEMLHWLEQ